MIVICCLSSFIFRYSMHMVIATTLDRYTYSTGCFS